MQRWVPSLYKTDLISTDTANGRSVTFTTSVEVTGDASAALPESAFRRLVCHFVVSKLQDGDLLDAQEKLIDLYLWHLVQNPPAIPQIRTHRAVKRKAGSVQRILIEDE